jgi:MFS family permease
VIGGRVPRSSERRHPGRSEHGYGRIVSAAALANLSDGVREVALPLLAAALTRDTMLVSGLAACAYLPWLLLGMPIGTLVDRGRPERFMVAAGTCRCVLLTVLAVTLVTGHRSLVLLYVVAFLLGVGEAVHDNAAQSLIPRVVADRDLEKANSRLVTVERVGQDLAGPAIGGVLFAVGAASPFFLQTACLALAVILIMGVRTPAPEAAGPVLVLRGVFAQAAEGIRWLWRADAVRTVVTTGAAFTFLTQTWEPLLVLLVVETMGAAETTFGIVLALGAAGGILGALATPALVRRFDSRALQFSALAVTAAADLALAAFPNPPMAALALGLASTGFAVWNVLSVTLRQRQVPAAMLGRVNAANRTLSMTAAPLGALAGGAMAYLLDLRAPLWISGAALSLLTIRFGMRCRTAENLGRPQPGKAEHE